jgi:hypothetical protein
MPKYHVNFMVEGIVSFEIEAASKEEARQEAYRLVIDKAVPVTVLEVTGDDTHIDEPPAASES